MKRTSIFPILTLLGSVQSHYLFGRLILEGKWTGTWEYIREIQPRVGTTPDFALVYPMTDPDSVDMRCGRNASDFQGAVKTATVLAGDAVGIAAGEPMLQGDIKPWMYHPGFASAWLSKAPSDDLDAYLGDGDWFKILSVTNRTKQSLDFSDPWAAQYYDPLKAAWGTYRLDSYNFTIPTVTPPGKYLLRFEHIFPNRVDAQFYVSCAQIEVVNPSAVTAITPAPVVKIPGVYTRGQGDVYFDTYSYVLAHNLSTNDFIAPSPVVWRG
ncbi:putative cellulose-growth-specific protein [Rosellinia necatrix]|uniref:lytic cellulose monooxygenase (C4-dehydrogenating) n=1 Tax=Rosellinia necatrix TaxID=77044 RepID=A0A1W2TGY8_ROSNE|nr:putative cellulose-growth-specific protein [Rosellinia necatrix]